MIKQLSRISESKIITLYVAHETPDNGNNYEHSHVLIELKPPLDYYGPSNLFDLSHAGFTTCVDAELCKAVTTGWVHPNIKTISTKLHWNRALHYIAKQDPELAFLLTGPKDVKEGICERIWACSSLNEAMTKCCLKASDASGVKQIWGQKPRTMDIVIDDEPDFNWHRKDPSLLVWKPADGRTGTLTL